MCLPTVTFNYCTIFKVHAYSENIQSRFTTKTFVFSLFLTCFPTSSCTKEYVFVSLDCQRVEESESSENHECSFATLTTCLTVLMEILIRDRPAGEGGVRIRVDSRRAI